MALSAAFSPGDDRYISRPNEPHSLRRAGEALSLDVIPNKKVIPPSTTGGNSCREEETRKGAVTGGADVLRREIARLHPPSGRNVLNDAIRRERDGNTGKIVKFDVT